MALVVLILVIPAIYSVEMQSIATDVTVIELKEIADYTSNSLGNLYFLANSTQNLNINLTKELLYLPLTVQDSPYILTIESVNGNATKVTAALKGSHISGESWLVPGLKVGSSYSLEVTRKPIVVGCYRNGNNFHIYLGHGV